MNKIREEEKNKQQQLVRRTCDRIFVSDKEKDRIKSAKTYQQRENNIETNDKTKMKFTKSVCFRYLKRIYKHRAHCIETCNAETQENIHLVSHIHTTMCA